MKPIDLTKILKKYKSGWVALDQKKSYKVVAYGRDFKSITAKVKRTKNILVMPASKNYFGFITLVNV